MTTLLPSKETQRLSAYLARVLVLLGGVFILAFMIAN